MKYLQVLALEVFTIDTNRPLDMNEPCLAGKVIIAIHSKVTLLTVYHFEASQYLIVSILMGGHKVPFC